MSVFKCKMCGGALEISEGEGVAVCEYCGTKQTVPKLSSDERVNLYDRADHYRRANDYDKAMSVYEKILDTDRTDAESYWSIVLCRYGIEYVEDPVSHRRVPTVNRAQYTSVFADEDYKSALEYADGAQRVVYEAEAKAIDDIQKGILAISQKEEPFDVFICYKETDENGQRTHDSVLANDLYHELTQEGFKVFFSRITLEDKLGAEYEPYIFAALNSSKVMIVIGTKAEYFNAVWVKNEWSRYLALIKKGEHKTLIPAYRDMDPYDMPDEFSNLQAQDMSKLGFIQDLIRGIKKLTETETPVPTAAASAGSAENVPLENLLKRAAAFAEDGAYGDLDEYCKRILDIDPENIPAFFLSALSAFCQNRDAEKIVNRLKRYAPDITEAEKSLITQEDYRSWFWMCVKYKLISRVKFILSRYPDIIAENNPNAKNPEYPTLSRSIIEYPDPDVVRILLECGADANTCRTYRNEHGTTQYSVLSDAICHVKSEEIVGILLDHGADPNRIEKSVFNNERAEEYYFEDGKVAAESMLTYAILVAKSQKMVSLLLDHGANANSYRIYKNRWGSTEYSVLSDAIWNAKSKEIVGILLDHGADANRAETTIYPDRKTFTRSMLTDAILDAKSPEMVKLLIDHGATWDHVITHSGKTKKELRYPYNKCGLSSEFVSFLKSVGWKGGLL